MVKIAILSPKNGKLVVDNLLFLAQIDDGSFANYALITMRGLTLCIKNLWLKPPHENEKYELVYLRAIRK